MGWAQLSSKSCRQKAGLARRTNGRLSCYLIMEDLCDQASRNTTALTLRISQSPQVINWNCSIYNHSKTFVSVAVVLPTFVGPYCENAGRGASRSIALYFRVFAFYSSLSVTLFMLICKISTLLSYQADHVHTKHDCDNLNPNVSSIPNLEKFHCQLAVESKRSDAACADYFVTSKGNASPFRYLQQPNCVSISLSLLQPHKIQ